MPPFARTLALRYNDPSCLGPRVPKKAVPQPAPTHSAGARTGHSASFGHVISTPAPPCTHYPKSQSEANGPWFAPQARDP
ncbi:hypothetical protein BJX65DRAFT_267685 [Aspergillus insuetus]